MKVGRSSDRPAHRRALVAMAMSAVLVGSCGDTAVTHRPALSAAPRATIRITERPTTPAGLQVSGAEAPRNVPDPCAILTVDELEMLMGAVPEVAVRGFVTGDDSWTCLVQAVSGDSAQVGIAIYVNAAYRGWDDDMLAEAGMTAVSDPAVTGVVIEGASVAVALGLDLLVLDTSRADGSATDPDVVVSAAAAAIRRLMP